MKQRNQFLLHLRGQVDRQGGSSGGPETKHRRGRRGLTLGTNRWRDHGVGLRSGSCRPTPRKSSVATVTISVRRGTHVESGYTREIRE